LCGYPIALDMSLRELLEGGNVLRPSGAPSKMVDHVRTASLTDPYRAPADPKPARSLGRQGHHAYTSRASPRPSLWKVFLREKGLPFALDRFVVYPSEPGEEWRHYAALVLHVGRVLGDQVAFHERDADPQEKS
jgi:hypothetical protein